MGATASGEGYYSASPSVAAPPPADGKADRREAPKPEAKRMLVYVGGMGIQVVDIAKATEDATRLVKSLGGFIESTDLKESSARLVLRVPAPAFDSAIKDLTNIGKVTRKDISASDLTKDFADLENRIASEKAVRARLYTLLKSVKKPDDKIAILREIQRLNSSIEAMALNAKLISDRASMATIVADFELKSMRTTVYLPSPFGWLSALSPTGRSIQHDSAFWPLAGPKITLEKPSGFFSSEKKFYQNESDSLYFSPEKVVIRAGAISNEPKADLVFWQKALLKEMKQRGYEIVEEKPPITTFKVLDGLNEYYYAIMLITTDKNIFVIEAYYPDKKTFEKENKALSVHLQTAKVD